MFQSKANEAREIPNVWQDRLEESKVGLRSGRQRNGNVWKAGVDDVGGLGRR